LFDHDVLLCGVNIKAKQPAYQNLMRKPRTLGHTMKDIDRLYRYKSLLTSRHAVSSDELMAVLGISIATLKRDMANLRERLNITGGIRPFAGWLPVDTRPRAQGAAWPVADAR
jgi:hypothetical protein